MSNKFLVICLAFLSHFGCVQAQSIKSEAYKLAKIQVNENWESLTSTIDLMLDGLGKKAEAELGSVRVSNIFIEELKSSLSRENVTKMMAALWSDGMTEAELNEATAFLTSPTGKKYGTLSKSLGITKYFFPIITETCSKTRNRLQSENLQNAGFERMCQEIN